MSQGESWSPLTKSAFSGNRPGRVGDLSVETHGVAPIPADQRYGTPARLFTVWFAPIAALIAFVLGYAAAIPFMNTSLIRGTVAKAWHGADIAYFVNLLVATVLYGGYRLLRRP